MSQYSNQALRNLKVDINNFMPKSTVQTLALLNKIYPEFITQVNKSHQSTKHSPNPQAMQSKQPIIYMADGTALTLHIKHRMSQDIDLFTNFEFNPQSMFEILKTLVGQTKIKPNLKLTHITTNTLYINLNNTKLSIIYYPYPLLKEVYYYKNIPIASILDIALMKLTAIASRAKKRDYIDLYFILKEHYTLAELLQYFDAKYPDYNKAPFVKALTFFEDIQDTELILSKPVTWENVKKYLTQQAQNYFKYHN